MRIENIVGTGSLGVEIDVTALADDIPAPEVTYNPDNYHGLYLRLEKGGPLITLYRTGSYNITGADSLEELNEVKDGFLRLVAGVGIIERPTDDSFSVRNMVCTADLGFQVDLNQLAIGLGLEQVEYEPEQFPGLVYRPAESECVILVFGSGRAVITGARDEETAVSALDFTKSQIESVIGPSG